MRMPTCRVLCALLCCLIDVMTLPAKPTPTPATSGNKRMTTVDTQNIAGVKKELLEKLGMTERPQLASKINPVPQALLDEFYNDVQRHEREYWEREESSLKKIFVAARPYKDCSVEGTCIKFNYSTKTDGSEISEVNLWVFQDPKQKEASLTLTLLNGEHAGKTLLRSRLRSKHRGWASINIVHTKKWVSLVKNLNTGKASQSIDVVVQVSCVGCKVRTNNFKLPLLEFKETSRINRRRRRSSTQCHNGGKSESCCLDDNMISFKDIGWDDWIVSPKSYNAKKCHGNCNASHSALNEHSTLLKLISAHSSNKLKLCCTPQRFEPLLILYRKEHKIVRQEIPDLIVSECGCA